MNIAFLQNPVSGDSGTKCDPVIITPESETTPLSVSLNSDQTDGWIFYTKVVGSFSQPDPVTPTHSGDTPTGITVRVMDNHATVSTGSNFCTIAAICYQSGFLDSDQNEGYYVKAGTPP